MSFLAGSFDVAVIGAGHAGIEAALASARLGCNTVAFTINMDAVGNCPCNPSIGGTAKGHLVREIDALGGEMGKTADESMLQMRMLNRGKGPAVHSLRAQIDRRKYSSIMKHKMELQRNLQVHQAEIVSIKKQNEVWLLETRLKAQYQCKAVIIATGTFLGGRVYVGDVSYESGPDGIFPAAFLGQSLKELGLSLRRFKTGTPARVLRSSINFSELEEQLGDEPVIQGRGQHDHIRFPVDGVNLLHVVILKAFVPFAQVGFQRAGAPALWSVGEVRGEIEIPPAAFPLGMQNPVSFGGTKEMGF